MTCRCAERREAMKRLVRGGDVKKELKFITQSMRDDIQARLEAGVGPRPIKLVRRKQQGNP